MALKIGSIAVCLARIDRDTLNNRGQQLASLVGERQHRQLGLGVAPKLLLTLRDYPLRTTHASILAGISLVLCICSLRRPAGPPR